MSFLRALRPFLFALLLFALAPAGCRTAEVAEPLPTEPPPTATAPPPTATRIPPTVTPTPTATATPSPTVEPTPYGCVRPPDDYTRVTLRGEHQLSMRTLWMLQWAQELYGGRHDFVKAVTQGSYNPGVGASFGTHDGGGAVDLSVRDTEDWFTILYDEFDAIILALRRAGFAAWVREANELYNGSALHIHAIAVGDEDLSGAAAEQLTGPAGYFRGYNGLPEAEPVPDKWGDPVICPWMEALGYTDLRE